MKFKRNHEYKAVFALSPAPSNASIRVALEGAGFTGVQVWNLDDAEDEQGEPGNRDRLKDDFPGLTDFPAATHWALGTFEGDESADVGLLPGMIDLRDAGDVSLPSKGTKPTPTPPKTPSPKGTAAKWDPEVIAGCELWRDGVLPLDNDPASDPDGSLRARCRAVLGLPAGWNPGDPIPPKPLPKPATTKPAKPATLSTRTIVALTAAGLGLLAVVGGAIWWSQKNAEQKRAKRWLKSGAW